MNADESTQTVRLDALVLVIDQASARAVIYPRNGAVPGNACVLSLAQLEAALRDVIARKEDSKP